jgi:hypothetical protein
MQVKVYDLNLKKNGYVIKKNFQRRNKRVFVCVRVKNAQIVDKKFIN